MPALHRLLNFSLALLVSGACLAGSKPDPEKGKATFAVMCGICHSTQESGGPIEGPNLLGVVGRKAGSQPDFTKYTEALKAYDVVWSVKTLDKFLISPMKSVPGTAMPMLIPDDKTRADVVAYLATLKK
jgi:cytochrome c